MGESIWPCIEAVRAYFCHGQRLKQREKANTWHGFSSLQQLIALKNQNGSPSSHFRKDVGHAIAGNDCPIFFFPAYDVNETSLQIHRLFIISFTYDVNENKSAPNRRYFSLLGLSKWRQIEWI